MKLDPVVTAAIIGAGAATFTTLFTWGSTLGRGRAYTRLGHLIDMRVKVPPRMRGNDTVVANIDREIVRQSSRLTTERRPMIAYEGTFPGRDDLFAGVAHVEFLYTGFGDLGEGKALTPAGEVVQIPRRPDGIPPHRARVYWRRILARCAVCLAGVGTSIAIFVQPRAEAGPTAIAAAILSLAVGYGISVAIALFADYSNARTTRMIHKQLYVGEARIVGPYRNAMEGGTSA